MKAQPRPAHHDGVVVTTSDVRGPIADIDVTTGVVTRFIPGRAPKTVLDAPAVDTLRAAVTKLHAQGDQRVRLSQFVNGETRFDIVVGGVAVTHVYEDEGGRMGEPLDFILTIAFGATC